MPFETLNETTFAIDGDDDELKIEVGDSKQVDFFPQVKTLKWDNEANFSVRLIDDQSGVVTSKADEIVYTKDDLEMKFRRILKGFDYELILKEKPKSNVILFSLNMKDVTAYYQPELTQEELDEGNFRSDIVIGSYSLYCSKKNNRYKVGKIGHLYRPKAIDADNNEVWCELNITGNEMSITIPQDFLDNAVYPVSL